MTLDELNPKSHEYYDVAWRSSALSGCVTKLIFKSEVFSDWPAFMALVCRRLLSTNQLSILGERGVT